MARKVPAIILEINEDGIEKLSVCAERDPAHQKEAVNFYTYLMDEIDRLHRIVRARKKVEENAQN